MWYLLIILALLMAAFMLTRLRLRFQLSPERRLLFVGFGRTGPEFDFVNRVVTIRLFGVTVKKSAMQRKPKTVTALPKHAETGEDQERATKPKRRRGPFPLGILTESVGALWRFVIGIIKGIIVEEAQGELALGFASPDVTGKVYGYYNAVAWMAPALTERFTWSPVFSGKTFGGTARVTVALPMYVVVYRTILLVTRLPIRKIITYWRSKPKGERHGQ